MPPCCAVQAPACVAHAARRLPIRAHATRVLRGGGAASRPHGHAVVRRRATGRWVAKAQGSGPPEPPKRPQDDPEYYSRLLKLEADPCVVALARAAALLHACSRVCARSVPRDNLTSNIKLAAGVTLLLAALVAGFLASNGAL